MSRLCRDCGVADHKPCICHGKGAVARAQQEELEESVSPMILDVCGLCREGAGGECHVPGCAFWMNRAPDIPLSSMLTRDERIAAADERMENFRPTKRWDMGGRREKAEAVLLAAGCIPYVNDDGGDR